MTRSGFLTIDAQKVFLLGYDMKLTPAEYRVLTVIAATSGVSAEEIMERGGFSGMSKSNVAVHICSINKKAGRISGRRLILFENDVYLLSKYM